MITFRTITQLQGLSADHLSDFMIDCNDEDYQRWWPENHLHFHTIVHRPGEIGNIVFFDEYVGKTRLRTEAVVRRYERGKLIEWQMKRLISLPVRIILSIRALPSGLEIDHVVAIGYNGIPAILDPFIRLLVPKGLESELDDHVRTEFGKLGPVLRSRIDG